MLEPPLRLLFFFSATLSLALAGAAPVRADEAGCASVSRTTVVGCALRASAAVRAERENVAAAAGRRLQTRPWFPAAPTLALTAAHRSGGSSADAPASVFNYSATLSQEVAVSGERASRRRAAESDVAAREHDVVATTRRIAADALVAYYDVVAARDALAVARRLETTSLQIARVTRARSDAGVGSALDAEVADAASLRIVQGRIAAERAEATSAAHLAALLGADPLRETRAVSGALEPLAGSDALADAASSSVAAARPEVRAIVADQHASEARAEAFRRARVPPLTLQVFAQNDGFDEKVLGGGVALPIPLPEPVGRRFAGEIEEAEALGRANAARAEAARRELSGELARAAIEYRSRRSELALYAPERITRAEQLLSEIGREIEAGRLPARAALVAQAQLIEILRGQVEARLAACLASVDLALAAGVPLEQGAR